MHSLSLILSLITCILCLLFSRSFSLSSSLSLSLSFSPTSWCMCVCVCVCRKDALGEREGGSSGAGRETTPEEARSRQQVN